MPSWKAGSKYSSISRQLLSSAALPRWHSSTMTRSKKSRGYSRNRPVPFDFSNEYGLALAQSGSAAWLSAPSGVWTASLAASPLDVSADVLEAETDDSPLRQGSGQAPGGRLRLVLRNDDGRYSAQPLLKAGSEVRVSPGYVTSSGPQASAGPAYWIDGVELTSGGGEAAAVVHASDGWGLLEAWRARRQYAWAAGAKNVFGILQFLFARAGLELSSTDGGGEPGAGVRRRRVRRAAGLALAEGRVRPAGAGAGREPDDGRAGGGARRCCAAEGVAGGAGRRGDGAGELRPGAVRRYRGDGRGGGSERGEAAGAGCRAALLGGHRRVRDAAAAGWGVVTWATEPRT